MLQRHSDPGAKHRARPAAKPRTQARTDRRARPIGRPGSIGGLAAGVRVEQAALYYQALALEKLGQDDRAKAIFAQLVEQATKRSAAGQR